MKLSERAILDLCNLAVDRSYKSAFSVLQLVDDPNQRVMVALAITKNILTLTAKLAEHAKPELNYERLVHSLSNQAVALALSDQPPTDWLNTWRNK